jgi:hypothetical protein
MADKIRFKVHMKYSWDKAVLYVQLYVLYGH